MEKLRSILRHISGINLAYIMVLALMVKAVVADVSFAAFLLTVPILSYEAYKIYIKSKTPEPVKIDEAVMKRLDAHKEEMDNMKAKLTAQTLEKNLSSTSVKRYF